MDIFEALKFLSANRFFRFGDIFSKFYLNFKLKGKHYYKAFWVDYNGSFNKLLIRENKHRYRNLNLDKVERVVINFCDSSPLIDLKNVKVVDRVDLIDFCNDLKKFGYIRNSDEEFSFDVGDFNFVFERQNLDYSVRMKMNLRYSLIYRIFCLVKALKSISEDDVIDTLQSNDFMVESCLGDKLRLIKINGEDISEF